jgi:hypothetical protein
MIEATTVLVAREVEAWRSGAAPDQARMAQLERACARAGNRKGIGPAKLWFLA